MRFAIHPQAWRERGRDGYLALVDQGVEWARERDLLVIVDWHSIGNLRTELYQSANYDTTQKETFEFWRAVSARYAGDPTVAFYEIYNEPILELHAHRAGGALQGGDARGATARAVRTVSRDTGAAERAARR